MNQALSNAVIQKLVEDGFLSSMQLHEVESSDQSTPAHSLRTLITNGSVPELAFAKTISEVFGVAFISKQDIPTQQLSGTDHLSAFLVEHEALPIDYREGRLRIIMTDPTDDFVLKVLGTKLNCEIEPSTSLRSDILTSLNTLYTPNETGSVAQNLDDIPDDLQNESPLVRELHRLIQRAVSARASDIHFEPLEGSLKVRFRTNGMLRDIHTFPAEDSAQVMARLKLMSRLDVSERRRPQDGRFKFPADGKVIDLRVSTLPLNNGESIVLRLLEAELSKSSLSDLGFTPDLAEKLQQQVSQQQGLILVTGPTGSGKTTTLYSLLSYLNRPELKIISIEDPVELSIPGINQIQVDEQHGLSFADALRSVLRQDPDIIMVGEIRDKETAQMAAQAALTGHLVLSTLHTSSAPAAVTRLQNLGLPNYLISATLSGVLAQRLLRRICEECSGASSDVISATCQSCDGSGFIGRTSVAEYLPFREIKGLNLGANNIEEELQKNLLNGVSLNVDGINKVDQGLTNNTELTRVLGFSANPKQLDPA